jgi:hypothetical protein
MAALMDSLIAQQCPDSVSGYKIMDAILPEIDRILAPLRETNRELNRRIGALEHSLTVQSEKKSWYRYFLAASELFGGEENKRKIAESELAALLEHDRIGWRGHEVLWEMITGEKYTADPKASLGLAPSAVDEMRKELAALREQAKKLSDALNRMLVHFVGDEELCIECSEKSSEGCDSCYVITEAEQALSAYRDSGKGI